MFTIFVLNYPIASNYSILAAQLSQAKFQFRFAFDFAFNILLCDSHYS
jgi:hypothetical protein